MAQQSVCLFFEAEVSEQQIQDCCNVLDEYLATQGFDIYVKVSVGPGEKDEQNR